RGDELKIVVPQEGLDPLDFSHLAFRRFSVQPMDGPRPCPQHRNRNGFLPRPPAVAIESANPQARRVSLSAAEQVLPAREGGRLSFAASRRPILIPQSPTLPAAAGGIRRCRTLPAGLA